MKQRGRRGSDRRSNFGARGNSRRTVVLFGGDRWCAGAIERAVCVYTLCSRPWTYKRVAGVRCVATPTRARAQYTRKRARSRLPRLCPRLCRLIGFASSRRTNLFTMYTVGSNGRADPIGRHAIHDYIPEVTPRCATLSFPRPAPRFPRKIESRVELALARRRFHLVITREAESD